MESESLTRCIVLALGQAGALGQAKEVAASLSTNPHSQLITLAHAHALAGDLEGAYGIADQLKEKAFLPSVSWATAMVSGVRVSSEVPYAIRAIETLVRSGVPPDDKQLVHEFQRLSGRMQKFPGSSSAKTVAIQAVMASMAEGMRIGTEGTIRKLGQTLESNPALQPGFRRPGGE